MTDREVPKHRVPNGPHFTQPPEPRGDANFWAKTWPYWLVSVFVLGFLIKVGAS